MQELAKANGSIQHLLSQLQVQVNIYDRSNLDPAVLNDWWAKYIALSIKLAELRRRTHLRVRAVDPAHHHRRHSGRSKRLAP